MNYFQVEVIPYTQDSLRPFRFVVVVFWGSNRSNCNLKCRGLRRNGRLGGTLFLVVCNYPCRENWKEDKGAQIWPIEHSTVFVPKSMQESLASGTWSLVNASSK